MNEDLKRALDSIQSGVTDVQGRQKTLEDREEARAAESAQLLEMIQKTDSRLESTETALASMEAEVTKSRFGTGTGLIETDALRSALPDRVKRWIGPVAESRGYQIIQKHASPNSPLADPVVVTASLAWFQAKINAVTSMSMGDVATARNWTDEANSLQEIMDKMATRPPVTKADLAEGGANTGQTLVPTVTEAVIGWLVKEASVVRKAGPTTIQMTTNQHNLPTLDNDFSVSWYTTEGTQITDSAPAAPFGDGNLIAYKQGGLVTISNELVQDNIVNVMDFIMVHLTQQVGRSEDAQILEGTGSPITGLYGSSLTDVGAADTTLDFADLVKLIYGAEHATTIVDGVIFCHPFIMREAVQLTTGATGAPWLMGPTMSTATATNLLGVPVFMTSAILRNRGTGTDETVAYHGNPRYIVVGDRLATTFVANPWGGKVTAGVSTFEKDQTVLRLTRRVGAIIWVPGYFTQLSGVEV